jgi:serine/threonine-protein kinase
MLVVASVLADRRRQDKMVAALCISAVASLESTKTVVGQTLGGQSSRMFEPGAILSGRYEIIERIGVGGMGAVYRAREIELDVGRSVAIKVLPPHLATDEKLVQRFREEIKILARLDHPHIVPVYGVGQEGECIYYVMKFLKGETLKARIRRVGALPPKLVAGLGVQIADALDYIHRAGTIHRDIKSVNIILDDEDRATLMDFGIAKVAGGANLTAAGEILGTAPYMAPEQWERKNDPRSDFYALGILLYEALTGSPPFTGQSLSDIMAAHLRLPPPPLRSIRPQAPEALAAVIHRCLEKDPNDRYAKAGELLTALQAAVREMETRGPEAPAPDAPDGPTIRFDSAAALSPSAELPPAASPSAVTEEVPPTTKMAAAQTLVAQTAASPRIPWLTRRRIQLGLLVGAPGVLALLLLLVAVGAIGGGAMSSLFTSLGNRYFAAGDFVSPPFFNAARCYRLALRYDGANQTAQKRLHETAVNLARLGEEAAHRGAVNEALELYAGATEIENNPLWVQRYNRLFSERR